MSAQSAAAHALRLVVSPHAAEQDPDDRRAHHRRTLAELPWLREVRLKYGPRAVLINLSVGGAQLETAGYRLNPGSTVVVEITGESDEPPIPSRVVRCQIVGLAPHPTYRSALEFKRSLAMPIASGCESSLGLDANPVHQHARMLLALRRLEGRSANSVQVPEGRLSTAAEIEIMSTVLAMLDTPAARRAGRTFARELATLFSIVSQGIEEDAPEDVLIARLLERLRRTIPVRAVRVTHTLAVSHSDAVYFDLPVSGNQSGPKLVVEFPRDFRSEEWQFQYLKAAAHFFAFVQHIGRKRAASRPEAPIPTVEEDHPVEEARPSPRDDGFSAVSRVVVRYRDGHILKGFTRDFLASRGVAEVWPSPNAPLETRVTVPLGQLKALFFVRDLDGDAKHVAARPAVTNSHGRKVAVTFTDGEELTGLTLNYQPGGVGFFLHPLGEQSNNTRVFVVCQAIRHVRFP
jgi:PilZ domain